MNSVTVFLVAVLTGHGLFYNVVDAGFEFDNEEPNSQSNLYPTDKEDATHIAFKIITHAIKILFPNIKKSDIREQPTRDWLQPRPFHETMNLANIITKSVPEELRMILIGGILNAFEELDALHRYYEFLTLKLEKALSNLNYAKSNGFPQPYQESYSSKYSPVDKKHLAPNPNLYNHIRPYPEYKATYDGPERFNLGVDDSRKP